MRGPLIILALLSICGGWIGIDRSDGCPHGALQWFSRASLWGAIDGAASLGAMS